MDIDQQPACIDIHKITNVNFNYTFHSDVGSLTVFTSDYFLLYIIANAMLLSVVDAFLEMFNITRLKDESLGPCLK